jgi:hypothetical protein
MHFLGIGFLAASCEQANFRQFPILYDVKIAKNLGFSDIKCGIFNNASSLFSHPLHRLILYRWRSFLTVLVHYLIVQSEQLQWSLAKNSRASSSTPTTLLSCAPLPYPNSPTLIGWIIRSTLAIGERRQ